MRRALPLLLLVLGAGVLAVLFFALRPDGDDEEEPTAVNEITTVEEEEPATTDPPAEVPTLRVTVLEGRPQGGIQRLMVAQGDPVRLVARADVSDQVHVHGYDLKRNVGPGRPAQLAFRATIPGRFEIELEESGLLIAELEVRP